MTGTEKNGRCHRDGDLGRAHPNGEFDNENASAPCWVALWTSCHRVRLQFGDERLA